MVFPAAPPGLYPGIGHSASAGWLFADRTGRSRPPGCGGIAPIDPA